MKKIFYFVLIALLACVYACGDASKGSESTKKSYASFDELEVNATYDELMAELRKYDYDTLAYKELTKTRYDLGKQLEYGLLYGKVNGVFVYFIFLPDDEGTLRYREYFTTDKLDPEKATDDVFDAFIEGMTVNEYLTKEKAKEENETASQAELKAKYDAVSKADYPTDVDPFVTPDLKFCQVRGHVKEIRVEGTTIAQFDKNGTLTMYLFVGDEHPRFKRNAQGQIVVLTYDRRGDHEKETDMTIKYDKNGYCSEWNDDWDGQRKFTFDASGRLLSLEWLYDCKYKYTKFDDHGNYLEAIIKVDKDEDEVEYGKEKRTIIYY